MPYTDLGGWGYLWHSTPLLLIKLVSVSHFGSTRLCWTPALPASLSSGSTPARPHKLTSVFTHSGHVFRGLPFFLEPGSGKFVIDLIRNMARCTWSYHLSHQQRRTDIMSLMQSFCSIEAESGIGLHLLNDDMSVNKCNPIWGCFVSVLDATDPTVMVAAAGGGTHIHWCGGGYTPQCIYCLVPYTDLGRREVFRRLTPLLLNS